MGDIDKLAKLAIIAIGLISICIALKLAEDIVVPVALAMVIGIVLSPLSDLWARIGLGSAAAAGISLLLTLCFLGMIGIIFQPIVARMIENAPQVINDMRGTVDNFRRATEGLKEISDDVTEAMSSDQPQPAATQTAPAKEPAVPSATDALMLAPALLGQFVIFAGTLFFFLATRVSVYEKIAAQFLRYRDRIETAQKLRLAERRVSSYFLTIAAINAGLGAVTALMLRLLDMPDALSWGVLAFLANFIVYIGPAAFTVALLFTGIAEFDGIMSVLPALCFVGLNTTEGQFVTPALVGRQMEINPLIVFLAIVFGIWLWGPAGGIVAIPLLVWGLVINGQLSEMPRTEASTPENARPHRGV